MKKNRPFEVNAFGSGWSFTSLIRAPNKAKAEVLFRKDKRFRRMARQNAEDWRAVPVVVDLTSLTEFATPCKSEPKLDRRRFQRLISA